MAGTQRSSRTTGVRRTDRTRGMTNSSAINDDGATARQGGGSVATLTLPPAVSIPRPADQSGQQAGAPDQSRRPEESIIRGTDIREYWRELIDPSCGLQR